MSTSAQHDQPGRDLTPRWLHGVDHVVRLSVYIAGAGVMVMALHIFVDVASRSLFGKPLPGTLDIVSAFWMPAVAMLGMGYAQFRNQHIRVELLVDSATDRVKRIYGAIADAAVAITLLCMTYAGGTALVTSFLIGESAVSTPWVQLWPGRLLLCLSLVLCAAVAAVRVIALILGLQPALDQLASREASDGEFND
ncbi:hypothetical protein GCM10027416_22990 [Okibacterium endophyticum]